MLCATEIAFPDADGLPPVQGTIPGPIHRLHPEAALTHERLKTDVHLVAFEPAADRGMVHTPLPAQEPRTMLATALAPSNRYPLGAACADQVTRDANV
jgi:hypothetical protein